MVRPRLLRNVSFNSRAVYQRYMAGTTPIRRTLNAMTPADAGRRYVEAMGGAERCWPWRTAPSTPGLRLGGRTSEPAGVRRSANTGAKALLARAYDQLGYQSEDSLWRNIYLTGAQELRDGVQARGRRRGRGRCRPDQKHADAPAARSHGGSPERRQGGRRTGEAGADLPERHEQAYVTVQNGVLIHEAIPAPGPVDATLTPEPHKLPACGLPGRPPGRRDQIGIREGRRRSGRLDQARELARRAQGRLPIVHAVKCPP